MAGRGRASWVLVAAAVALILVAGEFTSWKPVAPAPPSPADFCVANVTGSLGATFAHGAPQAFGFNGSTVLVTGVVGDPVNSTVPFPLLGTFADRPGATPENLSEDVAGLFHGGDTLGVAWNGTAWLISGEAAWGPDAGGAAAVWSRGLWTNLTPTLRPYFGGIGGIWFVGWNGTSWLLGGQSSTGAALVGLHGATVVNYAGEIPHNVPGRWIQFLAWNGTAWLVAGQGTFGLLTGGRYVDLEPSGGFSGGVFAADWNGHSWLVGGGSPGALEFLVGTRISSAPALPTGFSRWVSSITWDGRGWYVGGEGSVVGGGYAPALAYLDTSSGSVVDLSGRLPEAFAGGQIQFGARAPFGNASTVLLLGQGGLVPVGTTAGPSTGAAATVGRC